MAVKTINVNLPKATEASKSIEIIEAVKTSVSKGDVVTVEKAFENKDNSFFLVLEGAGTVTIKAGNNYPNAMLGDLNATVATCAVINIQDLARFENRDNTIVIDCANYAGTIMAIGKRAGLEQFVATRG